MSSFSQMRLQRHAHRLGYKCGVFYMDDQYTATIPKIVSASFTPNPVSMNTATVLSVEVIEETVILTPTWFQSNEIYSGEA